MIVKVLNFGPVEDFTGDVRGEPVRFTSDADCREYDWLVVYDEFKRPERLACPREQTILATCEPISIKHYSRAYVRQFGHLLTNRPREAERHPHYHLGRGYYKWFNDRSYAENLTVVLPPKTKQISAVCSSKQMRHTSHRARFDLLANLQREIPGLDWFGHGVRAFGRKYEVMDPYRYQVVVENHIAPHHWSEKLSDAFLCECLPFYAGAPDIANDIPADSLIPIPIDRPDEAARIIRNAIASGEYEKRRESVLEAKRLILARYNFWQQIVDIIASSESSETVKDESVVLYPRRQLRRHSLSAAIEDLLHHAVMLVTRGV